MSQKPYTYVLVREDIAVPQQTVQACHAALEAGFAFEAPAETSFLVLLTVASQEALQEAARRLMRHGVEFELFFEPDGNMGYSALATRPLCDSRQRRLLSKYPMLGAPRDAKLIGAVQAQS